MAYGLASPGRPGGLKVDGLIVITRYVEDRGRAEELVGVGPAGLLCPAYQSYRVHARFAEPLKHRRAKLTRGMQEIEFTA